MAGTSNVVDNETKLDDGTGTGFGSKVILFNCRCHSFDAVEKQLILAIKCSLGEARRIANEVHTRGSCEVFKGTIEECTNVCMILEDIQLVVKIV